MGSWKFVELVVRLVLVALMKRNVAETAVVMGDTRLVLSEHQLCSSWFVHSYHWQ